MTNKEIIEHTVSLIQQQFSSETTGHDWYHIERVWKLAKQIATIEGHSDLFVVEMGALLHDIADHKFHDGDETIGPKVAKEFLERFNIDTKQMTAILDIVKEISFKGKGIPTPMSSKEGEIVQDADRLDAIGAIGIARTFAYGGSKKRSIYDPNIKPICHTSFAAYKTSTSPTINHFYEKLLTLRDKMNTETGKKEAKRRHAFLEEFLQNFYMDWDARIS
ncbi:MAG: phosphohydrolase [Bacteroidetes bacterium]|nr:MAG: phosphohydrolase [Bacteroidota bacterium]